MKSVARVVEIHVVCRDRQGVTEETSRTFESHAWDIAPEHLRQGIVFALHQKKTEQSYLQGTIQAFRPARDRRYILTVDRSPMPTPWKGGGAGEIGYLWEGADWTFLPQVPIAIRGLWPGGNHALKNLNEANSNNFRFPRAQTFNKGGKSISSRQAAFYDYLLRIALALEARFVPYAFRDTAGQAYRLDDGAIGRAIRQGILEEPYGNRDGTVRGVTIADGYWNEKENDGTLERFRQQNRDQDGISIDLFEEFDPTAVSVEFVRREVLATREIRDGQQEFRRRLLYAYDRRCGVTGCAAEQALDAAHIIPNVLTGDAGMDPRNGLLLRADIHKLFDSGVIGFRFESNELPNRHIVSSRRLGIQTI